MLEKIIVPKGSKKRFQEMSALRDFTSFIIESGSISRKSSSSRTESTNGEGKSGKFMDWLTHVMTDIL